MNKVACPSDEELIPLLAGETVDGSLSSHLQECDTCRRRLDVFRSDIATLRSFTLETVPQACTSAGRPAQIGKYLVVGEIDSGGQANVYHAVHPTLDKELAIKLSKRVVARLSDHRPLLVAEGKLLAKLDHPNLAQVYDLDFHDDLPFLAMEYVRGPSLWKHAEEAPLSPRRAAEIVAEVARALDVVHKHGIVHQDVKPHNILIDETNRPRLIDFGMARLRHAWDDGSPRTSGGTPAFMAPEQARSEEAAVGPRSDIFALGGVLYYLLTKRIPFCAATISETLSLAGRCDFDRTALNRPDIPRSLRNICLKAMAPNPADRYLRAEEMAEDIERYLSRPRRLLRLAGLVAAALLFVGLGVSIWALSRPTTGGKQQPADIGVPLEAMISRGGKTLDLAAALPLDPAKDQVQIRARIPAGHHALLLHVNGNGEVTKLPVRTAAADNHTLLVAPPDGLFPFEKDVPGTEVFLLLAAEDPATLDQLDKLTASLLAGLPRMGPYELVVLTRDEALSQKNVGLGPAERSPKATVETQLDQLRERLREKPLSVIRGVAYSR